MSTSPVDPAPARALSGAAKNVGVQAPLVSPWAMVAVITGAVALAYGTSLRGPFVFDDIPAILTNPTLRHPAELGRLLFPPGMEAGTVAGRPLLNVSLALNFAFGGTGVWGYHFTNVLIHLVTASLLFGVVRRTPWSGERRIDPVLFAGAVALLWAVHPLATQAVTYVIQRAESLMSLCYVATLYCYVRGWKKTAVLACVAGMGTKEAMVSAPLAVLLYDRAFLAGSFRAAWSRNRAFYLSLAGTWLLLGGLVLSTHGRGGSVGFASWAYALTESRAIVTYLKLAFWPAPLVFDYGIGLETSLAAVAGSACVVLLLLGLSIWALVRRPGLGFISFCFFAILAPSSSFLPIATEPIAEHRMYLPLAAVVIFVMMAVDAIARRTRALKGKEGHWILGLGLGLLAAGLGMLTVRRNEDYRSTVSLFADTVQKCPGNPRAHNDLGTALREKGDLLGAEREFEAAVRVDSTYAPAQYNLGVLLLDQRQPTAALPHLDAARQVPRHQAELHLYLAQALNALQRYRAAAEEAEQAMRLAPQNPEAAFALGSAEAAMGQFRRAADSFGKATILSPENAGYHVNYGNALLLADQVDGAVAEYRTALKYRPNDLSILANLRLALGQLQPR